MQLTPPDTHTANIPQVPDSNTTVQYYLEASDLANNIGYDLMGAPDSVHSFIGGVADTGELGIAEQDKIPTEFTLHQNLPNPFSLLTAIIYSLPESADSPYGWSMVKLKIYDLTGKLVRTLVDERQKPGYYRVNWDGRDDQGQRVSPGIYFYRLEAHTGLGTGSFKDTRKLILLK